MLFYIKKIVEVFDRDFYKSVDQRDTQPPFQAVWLIRQAISESPEKQMTCSGIMNWIVANFSFYKRLENETWWKV
jgi:hypothetical protein